MIRNNKKQTEYEKWQSSPGKFNYGFSVNIGFQPLNWFALNGGLRYSYIDSDFHMIYATVQTMFFMNDPKYEDFEYLFLQLGSNINATASDNANFVGLG